MTPKVDELDEPDRARLRHAVLGKRLEQGAFQEAMGSVARQALQRHRPRQILRVRSMISSFRCARLSQAQAATSTLRGVSVDGSEHASRETSSDRGKPLPVVQHRTTTCSRQ